MVFSNGDAKKEIAEIISGSSGDERPVTSPKQAFQIVAIYPAMMLLTVTLMWFAFYVSVILAGDNSGLGLKFYLEAAQLVMGYGVWGMDIARRDNCSGNILYTH